MIAAYLQEQDDGLRILKLVFEVHDDGTPAEGAEIPLAALASWRELLGIDDAEELIEAFLHNIEHGSPEPDPETGENVFTVPYQVLRAREEAREAEALRAEQEGAGLDTVRQASSLAAYQEVHTPIDGGDCLMDRVRADARAQLGLPSPTKVCGEDSRLAPMKLPQARPRALQAMQPHGGKAEVLDSLIGEEEYLLGCTQRFLNALGGSDHDPLVEPPPPPPVPPTLEEIRARHGADKNQEAT